MDITLNEMREKVSLCVIDRNTKDLTRVRDALVQERKVLDKWFDKYLDMFDRKMDPSNPNTKIWQLYHSKTKEYSDLQQLIRTTNEYLRKIGTV